MAYIKLIVFADMEDILNMRINRFHHLNISGQLTRYVGWLYQDRNVCQMYQYDRGRISICPLNDRQPDHLLALEH